MMNSWIHCFIKFRHTNIDVAGVVLVSIQFIYDQIVVLTARPFVREGGGWGLITKRVYAVGE